MTKPAKTPSRKKAVAKANDPHSIGSMIAAMVDDGFMHGSRAAAHDLISMATYSLPINERETNYLYATALDEIRMLQPRDGLEAQICTMMVGTMQASLETLRRSNASNQPAEIAKNLRNSAAKLIRSYADLADLLDRHRNKNTQKIVVQHQTVMVNGDAQVAQITGKGAAGHE